MEIKMHLSVTFFVQRWTEMDSATYGCVYWEQRTKTAQVMLPVKGKRRRHNLRFECMQVNIRLYAIIQTCICLLTFRMVYLYHVVSKKTNSENK